MLYYNGAEGDQSPVLDKRELTAYKKIEVYGKTMAEKAYSIYKEINSKETDVFEFAFQTIQLPERKAHPDFMETGGKEYGLSEETIKFVLDVLAPETVGMGSLRIGDLIIVGIPGEMAAGLGINIKNNLKKEGSTHVTIGGLANEWISYILSAEEYTNGGGYESSVSFYGPQLGKVISENALKVSKPLIRKN